MSPFVSLLSIFCISRLHFNYWTIKWIIVFGNLCFTSLLSDTFFLSFKSKFTGAFYFQFFNNAHNVPTLRLGQFFRPGSDENSLCMPTSVAVATSGEIFVADGYCNNRILKYQPKGDLIRIFPQDGGKTMLKLLLIVSMFPTRVCYHF